ncbi:hypothetical protein BKA70DRAFT_1400489 [Coprinopsis sp. MPI-PUGE-AT-0042]|nr:hypothetical protein BKA70DRAFT_1400489 [Coprinopsis sp. MPI-PUGE-AT-0042]
MSSEQTKTPKESRAKKWLRRFRGGSPSPAAQASAPSTPQSIASTVVSSTASLATQPTESEATSKSDGNNETPGPSGLDVAKDYLSVTGSFLQLVLKKLPDAVDSNPGMDDNANNVKKRIFATSELLLTVETALGGWEGSGSADETAAMEAFRREVGTEMDKLVEIRNQSCLRSFAVQEEDEQKIRSQALDGMSIADEIWEPQV